MKKIPAFIVILLALCGFVVQGCGEDDCPLTTTSHARFDFLDSKTHQTVALTNGATISGLAYVNGQLRVDTLFNQASNYMSLPLSYTSQTTFVMHYSETLCDTIELTHKNLPFVSNIECGTLMFHEVESMRYTTNVLDSVVLVNPNIDNEEKTNFNIYYRVTDGE